MREILFRGKDIKGNWYEGLLAHNIRKDEWYISNKAGISTAYQVRPETIGQFTGLTDKNGVKIFEGDIIKFEDTYCEGGEGYEYPGEWAVDTFNNAEIIIKDGCVCFGKTLFEPSVYEDIQLYYPNFNEWFKYAEVIGNIYDNPELMGGSKNG